MRYASNQSLQAVYQLLAHLYERADEPDQAMVIAAALADLGEDRSWASVWWAYGAVHHDLRDEAYDRALELLAHVSEPDEAKAAALMLEAEIKSTSAIERRQELDRSEQYALLTRAAALAPAWPDLHARRAYAAVEVGELAEARSSLATARRLYSANPPSADPFDVAITGLGLDRTPTLDDLADLEARASAEA